MFPSCRFPKTFRVLRGLALLSVIAATFGAVTRAGGQTPSIRSTPKSPVGVVQQLTSSSMSAQANATANQAATNQAGTAVPQRMRGTTNAQRQAAAARAAQRRAASSKSLIGRIHSNAIVGIPGAATPLTLDQLYFSGTYPNYANSPLPNVADTLNCKAPNYCGMRKFVDTLPLLNVANNLGNMLPIAIPDTTTFPGSDYYEISLVEYRAQLHSDLPAVNGAWPNQTGGTQLRGYVQTNSPLGTAQVPYYLGPIIVAQANRPVRVKFTNALPIGAGGNLFIPTDLTALGAGLGTAKSPSGSPYLQNRATVHLHGGNTPWISDGTPHQWTIPGGDWGNTLYPRGDSVSFVPDMFFVNGTVVPQCSATVTTSCSDAQGMIGELNLPNGATNDPGNGSLTFYYTNQQSGRLLFYHDHAYGTTRLNVYAGEAAGYLITDEIDSDLTNGTNATGVFTQAGIAPQPVVPAEQIPLVIQDKTFVPQNPASTTIYSVPVLSGGQGYTTATVSFSGGCTTSPTATANIGDAVDAFGQLISGTITDIAITNAGSGCSSDPVVSITGDGTGATAFASIATLSQQDPTWDTATWGSYGNLWYPHVYMPNQWPGNPDASNTNPMGRWDYASWFWPPFNGNPSQFTVRGDTPCPTSYDPSMVCPGFPTSILPAPATELNGSIHLGQGSTASLVPEGFMDTPVINGVAYPVLTVDPKPYRFRILSIANERTFNLSWFLACDSTGGTAQYTPTIGAFCPAPTVPGTPNLTEVGMVPAVTTAGFPAWWPSDGRTGGVPDPAAKGPSWIQIGMEGGVLPNVAVIPPAPIAFETNMRSVTVTNMSSHGLLLMSAERADAIVDFSGYACKTLILYNDAPAPAPAHDDRYDYYTGNPDFTGSGGAPTTLAGFGPNTRTLMQVRVGCSVTGPAEPAVNMTALNAAIPAAFNISQPPPVVPESTYNAAYKQNFKDVFPRLQSTDLTFTPIDPSTKKLSTIVTNIPTAGGTAVTLPLRMKTIQELFELDYGRMNATLGTELPLTNFNTQTTIPLGYIDPGTEDIYDSANVAASPVGIGADGSQIWMVIHNGVDSHAIHFHLYDVQLIDRFGWDGTTRAPFPDELGWKDTVRMNPLEIDFVALRAMKQTLPFPVPDSTRLFDVTKPAGADLTMSAFNPLNNAAPQTNQLQPMGWEYVWHCHLLGHEENDMMRGQVFQVPPETPVSLVATTGNSGVNISFTDMSLSEAGFYLQRSTDPTFVTGVTTLDIPGASPDFGKPVTYLDAGADISTITYYRVQSYKLDADYWTPLIGPLSGPNQGIAANLPNLVSPWSAVAQTGAGPLMQLSATGPISFGGVLVGTTSAAQTITITNQGLGTLFISGVTLTGTNATDFAQVNGCRTVNASSTCTITLTFTPSAIGPRVGNLIFNSTDPASPLVNVALTGTGLGPVMTLTPVSLLFGNQPVGSTSAAQIVTISNASGTAPLSITGIGISGANAGDFSLTQTCGTFPVTLAVGSSCTASVSFAPIAAGSRLASLTVNPAAPATLQSVALSGTGTVPSVTLTPPSLAFASQIVNIASAAQVVTLTNSGLAPLSISSIAFTGTNAADFGKSTTCGTTLASAASCTISVTFTPTARGARTAALVVTDNASTPTQSVTLGGTGIAPVASIIPVPLAFGIQVNATISAPQTVVLSNTGDAPLTINSFSIGGANASDFSVVPGTCAAVLPILTSCSIGVTFTPIVSGGRAATLSVATSDPLNPILTDPLSGTGTAVALSPAAISFGNQTVGTSSTSWTVTIGNAGPTVLTLNSITLTGANSADFTMNSQCAATIASGRSCNVRVRFAPTAKGARTAALTVSTSDVGVPIASVALTGTGTAPALTATPTTLTFSSGLNQTSPAQVVTVANVGTAPLTITGINLGGTNLGQFAQTNNCVIGTPMAVGATCTVNVTFRPTSTTPISKSQTLTINVAAPAVSQTVQLTGTVILPTYTVSPTSIAFPNQAINTTSAAQIVTVTNTSTVPLTITNIAIGGTNSNRFAQTSTCAATGFRPYPATLAAGASCTISTTFRPTTATTSTASLNISVGGGASPAQTQVPLTGTGQ
jgi:FtsP/CotA-like multicopper oxidase with cupredoxin domain